jgi:hypothetical protein
LDENLSIFVGYVEIHSPKMIGHKYEDTKRGTWTGQPKGIFSNQKSQFGYILECFRMENVHIFYVHLDYFTTIWCILWLFGIFCGRLV